MAKEATNLKPSMQIELYCLVVYKILTNIPLSMRELRNRPPKKSDLIIFYVSSSSSYKTRCHFEQHTKSRGSDVCLLCMHSSHANSCLWWSRSKCLPNSYQSDIWWLMTTSKDSYQLVLVRIYHSCAIVKASLALMTWICILRTLLSGWSFLFILITRIKKKTLKM